MSAQEKSEVLARVEEAQGENGGCSPSCKCPGALTTGGGPENGKGSRSALLESPGTGLAYRKRPQYWRRQGSLRNGAAGSWPLGSPTTIMEPRVQKAHLQTILKAAHVSRDKIELEFRV